MKNQRAVILLSGGIDSSTTMAIAKAEGYDLYAITFDYGQRHRVELEASKKIAKSIEVMDHLMFPVDLSKIGGSALTDKIAVPKKTIDLTHIPVTYVPARNTIFLSIALAYAEIVGSKYIFIGANAVDYSGYPDCRPEFIQAFEAMANLATKAGIEGTKIEIKAPLIDLTKAEIIRKGMELGLDYSLTISCYDPDFDGKACGGCDSCQLRLKGFADAGIDDPTLYQ